MNFTLALAGLGVGIVVGLTGMGGGALMTPILVLVFGVPPVAAVSSDLAASAVMKPFGGWVHARRGTVNWRLVGWLCLGSVPSAFLGVLLLRLIGDDAAMQQGITVALGAPPPPGGSPSRWRWPRPCCSRRVACCSRPGRGARVRPSDGPSRSGSGRCP